MARKSRFADHDTSKTEKAREETRNKLDLLGAKEQSKKEVRESNIEWSKLEQKKWNSILAIETALQRAMNDLKKIEDGQKIDPAHPAILREIRAHALALCKATSESITDGFYNPRSEDVSFLDERDKAIQRYAQMEAEANQVQIGSILQIEGEKE